MGFFDRFTSRKGKSTPTKPKMAPSKSGDADKQAFASVPSGKSAAPKAEHQKTAAAAPERPVAIGHVGRTLIRPLMTEKSTQLQKHGQYVFEVSGVATKSDILSAVQHAYGVRPVRVSVINLPGKIVRYGRTWGRQAGRRKAIVILPRGKSITVVP